MLGLVFTEFMSMIETKYGLLMLDDVIEKSNLPRKGVYASLGDYPQTEFNTLIQTFSNETQKDPIVLLKEFGFHFFDPFTKLYSISLEKHKTLFDFIENLEFYARPEVAKRYPDSLVPRVKVSKTNDGTIEMIYKSEDIVYVFIEGFIMAAMNHYNVSTKLKVEILTPDASEVKFII